MQKQAHWELGPWIQILQKKKVLLIIIWWGGGGVSINKAPCAQKLEKIEINKIHATNMRLMMINQVNLPNSSLPSNQKNFHSTFSVEFKQ